MVLDGLRRFVPHLPTEHKDPAKAAKPRAHVGAKHADSKGTKAKHAKAAHEPKHAKEKRVETTFEGFDGKSTFSSGAFDKDVAWKKFSGQAGGERLGASGEVNVLHAGVSGEGSTYADLAHGRLGAEGSVDAKATLVDAKGEAHANYGIGSTTVDAEGYVGAEAKADGKAEFNPLTGNADAEVDASAFAGARAQASVTQDIGPAEGTAGVEGWAGVGAEAKADVGLKNGKLEAEFSVGAALGLGGEVKFGVSVDPAAAAKDAAHLATGAVHTAEHTVNKLENGAKSVAHFFGL